MSEHPFTSRHPDGWYVLAPDADSSCEYACVAGPFRGDDPALQAALEAAEASESTPLATCPHGHRAFACLDCQIAAREADRDARPEGVGVSTSESAQSGMDEAEYHEQSADWLRGFEEGWGRGKERGYDRGVAEERARWLAAFAKVALGAPR